MRIVCLVVAAWALAQAACASPAAAPAAPSVSASGPLPIDAFYKDPAISSARLSPSGRYLAVLRKTGEASDVVVEDLQAHTGVGILGNKNKDYTFDWVRWKGDDRLIVGFTYLHIVRRGDKPDGEIIDFTYRTLLVAVDRDGKNFTTLFQPTMSKARIFGYFIGFANELRNDPDDILASAPTPEGVWALWRVNVRTGAAVRVEVGEARTLAWATDRDGAIVGRLSSRGRDVVIEGRAPGEKTWKEVTRIRPKDVKALSDFELLGPAEKPGQLYVAVKPESPEQGAARTVRIYDFNTHTLGPPVWPALKYDVVSIVSPEDSNTLDGVCYWIDTFHCDFKDPETQANFAGLETFFHGDESLAPISISADKRWWVFETSGPGDPGSFYLYDWQKKTMENLGERYPDLPGERLGVMQRFTYKARDGTEIPAYLTRPPGAPKAPLPLVVMLHGGPEARDDFDFDTWSQILATRGYLVLQPNFRGSGGYGVAYAEAGYGQWGAKMQDDVTDGVKQLIDSGQADPNRICIFGASYGGYAALIGGALQPELYKCVVSWAGISDLEHFMKLAKGGLFVGERSPYYDYEVKAIGDPEADKVRLARTSAVTYAAAYKPPVLLISGDADNTVPVDQTREMNTALQAARRDVRMIIVKGEDHSGWDRDHEKSAITEVVNFIAAHIGPGAPATPPARAQPKSAALASPPASP